MQTACWALTKSWLDVQVDEELSGGIDSDGAIERSPGQGDLNSQSYLGPESWPLQVGTINFYVYNVWPRELFVSLFWRYNSLINLD